MTEQLGVGDINSEARGTGARLNAGKPPMEFIPPRIVAGLLRQLAHTFTRGTASSERDWILKGQCAELLDSVSAFYEGGTEVHLFEAMLQANRIENDGSFIGVSTMLNSCATTFRFGASKYKAWNWAKGMPWSVPIACIVRHTIKLAAGETIDSDSGEHHCGHINCNLVMLATYVRTYPEGDDRPRALWPQAKPLAASNDPG